MTIRDDRRVVLIRHGRTAFNREDRLRGLADPPLDDVGAAQADALIPAMAALGVTSVHCSPLMRAVRTGTVIANALAIPVRADPRFTDRDYGPWTGELRQEVIDRFGSVDQAPGVEPVTEVLTRVLPALDALLEEQTGSLAVVTHDAVIRPIIGAFAPSVAVCAPNGSWNELRRGSRDWTVLSVDRLPGDSGAPT